MNLKKLIVLFIILLCCGCTAQYRIDFTDDEIIENFTIRYERSGETDSQLKDYYTNSIFAIDNKSFLNFNIGDSDSDSVDLKFDYTYDVNNYKYSNLASGCFSVFNFFTEENEYYFMANGPFLCTIYQYVDLESLDVVITTNHNVISHNADEISDDKYIWHIDSSNYDDVSIYFVTDSNVSIKSVIKSYKKLILPFTIALSLLFLVGFSIYIRYKRVNKI